jgi:uncharacterized membrane protein YesL
MFKGLMDPEGAFARTVNRIGQLILLNLLWILTSLPVITLGASSAALYSVLFHMLNGEDAHMARQYFTAWRENFRRSTGIWLILLVGIALFVFDLYFAGQMNSFIWRLLAVFGLQIVGMEMTFVFPLLAHYENNWRAHMGNALKLAVTNLPKMLLIWLIWAVPLGASLLIEKVFYEMIAVWVLIGYAGLSYLSAQIIWKIFEKIDNKNKEK